MNVQFSMMAGSGICVPGMGCGRMRAIILMMENVRGLGRVTVESAVGVWVEFRCIGSVVCG